MMTHPYRNRNCVSLPSAFRKHERRTSYQLQQTDLDEFGKVPWVICHHRQYKWVRNITRQADQPRFRRSAVFF